MKHRISATKTAVARALLLGIVWLNMAAMPCAMAFDRAEHDCPHCPPADEHAMAGHHGHAEAEQPGCATMQSDCCDAAEATLESRAEKFRNLPDFAPASALLVADIRPRMLRHVTAVDPPDPPGAFLRLHVLHCVYLD